MFATDLSLKAPPSLPSARTRIVATAELPTRAGVFRLVAFDGTRDGKEHVALVYGDVHGRRDVLVRLHSECLTSEVLGSLRCDCREQLELAKQRIVAAGAGVILYLRQEGRGIGLRNKVRAYELQDAGLDTVAANDALGFADDERDYAVAADLLACLGIASIRLLTNNPNKLDQMRRLGVVVTERVAHAIPPNAHNHAYLATKARRSGHLLDIAPPREP